MRKAKIVLIVFFVLTLVLISIFFYMTRGRPKVTVDYVAEYNIISQPQNFDPNQNAGEMYQAAYENLMPKPRQLQRGDAEYAEWPTDFNVVEDEIFKKWLTANEKSLQIFRAGSFRPYLWTKAFATDGMISIKFPEWVYLFHELIEAAMWNAKASAVNGKYTQAIDDILSCYRLSFQRCNNSSIFLTGMRDSLRQRQKAVYTAMLILKKSHIPDSTMIAFQQELEKITNAHSCTFDFSAEIMLLYDVAQRTYVYKPDESGLLSWKKKSDYYILCNDSPWPLVKSIFLGPTQKEVKNKITDYYDKLTAAFTLTPYELNQKMPNFFENLFLGCRLGGPLILDVYGSDYQGEFYYYYNTEAQYQALLVTIAVLRFQQNKGHIPNNFDELMKAGYLAKLPADPYSDKSLIYKAEENNFKIYSIGMNFKDDGGKGNFYPSWIGSSGSQYDLVFWPPIDLMKIYQSRKHGNQEPNEPIELMP